MIERENYLAVEVFLDHKKRKCGLKTVECARGNLNYLLRWADAMPFTDVKKIQTMRPSFPDYMRTVNRSDTCGGEMHLVDASVGRMCRQAAEFFYWVRKNIRGYGKISELWIDDMRPVRMEGKAEKVVQAVSVETVRKLMAVQVVEGDIVTWRDKAAVAFLFLSGARGSAFCTLTLDCVNMKDRTVKQYPTLGVKTKNGKSEMTALLNIPDLLLVVEGWDSFVRSKLPPTACWFPPMCAGFNYAAPVLTADKPGKERIGALQKAVKRLYAKAGLPAMSPHKFRHGLAVYVQNTNPTRAEYKAMSQNLMHEDIVITDRIYSRLPGDDFRQIFGGINEQGHAKQNEDMQRVMDALLTKLNEQDALLTKFLTKVEQPVDWESFARNMSDDERKKAIMGMQGMQSTCN